VFSSYLYGTVFNDANGNGTRDIGEVGIPDVLLTLDGNITTTTDPYGSYTFSTTIEGTHRISETDRDGYFSTTPNEVQHIAVEMAHSYGANFGDATPGLTITKTAVDLNGAPLYPGDEIAYRVVVTNANRFFTQSNITTNDSVPEGTGFVARSVVCTPGATCGEASGVVVVTTGSLGPGDVLTLSFRARVKHGVSSIEGNVARVWSDHQAAQETDPVAGGAVEPGLMITKAAVDLNDAPLYPGDEIAYRVVVTNTNRFYAQNNVEIRDPVPDRTGLVTESLACTAGAICRAFPVPIPAGYPMSSNGGGDRITATVGALGPGDVLTLTFRVRVKEGVSSIGVAVAVVGSDNQNEQETDPVCPPAGCAVEPGLAIAKTAVDLNGAPLYPGDQIAYRVGVTNTNSTFAQDNVTISDPVPESTGLVVGSVACTPGASCGEAGGVVTATTGILGPGDVLTLTFRVRVNGDAAFIGGNVASVESDNQNEQKTGWVYPPDDGDVRTLIYLPAVMRSF